MKPSEFFRALANEFPRLENQIVRDVVAVEAERFHAKNFRDEGFTDVALDKWAPRKKADKRKGRRALLVQTGTLKGHALKGRTRKGAVEFVFPLEYERVHNEGLRAGRGAGFDMPQRQFVGESEYLKQQIERKARKLIERFVKSI